MTHEIRRALMWIVLLVLLGYVSYLSFRAYLGPEFLIGFANILHC